MTVALKAIRSLHTVPERVSARFSRDMSIHGLLAADFTLNPLPWAEWRKLVPQFAHFHKSLPYFWPNELQRQLPAAAGKLLQKQQDAAERDWNMFHGESSEVAFEDYVYAWFLVGTRAFYYDTPDTRPYPWLDRLAVLPVADMFNHAATGCSVSFSAKSYTFTTDRQYLQGDEVCTSYGEHSNDFLLAEYGFLLQDNRHDCVCLDDFILPRLSQSQQAEWSDRGGAENFLLSNSGPCERTWIAMRLLCGETMPEIDGEKDPTKSRHKTVPLLRSILAQFLANCETVQQELEAMNAGHTDQRDMLKWRWKQIKSALEQSLKKLESYVDYRAR